MKKTVLSKSLRLTLIVLLLSGILMMLEGSVKAASIAPVNGNFEQGPGVGWNESSSNGYPIVWNSTTAGGPAPAHSGNWIGFLGDADNETSRMWQNVTIAPNTHLSFWYWLYSEDACYFDIGSLMFNSTGIWSSLFCSGWNTDGWVQVIVDLSAYSGQTGDLEFILVTDESAISSLLIDDVIFYDVFADVSIADPFLPYIKGLYNAGVTSGCSVSPLMYCPEVAVTRAQMAVFLLRGIHGSSYTPPAVGASTGFGDVPVGYWADAWIKQLAAEGITGGCGSGNYCPEVTVSRAQMAVFLLRAKHGSAYSPPNATGIFTDVPVGYWADRWIEQLALEGITSGCGSGVYCPEFSVTRGQMAVFIDRTFGIPAVP